MLQVAMVPAMQISLNVFGCNVNVMFQWDKLNMKLKVVWLLPK